MLRGFEGLFAAADGFIERRGEAIPSASSLTEFICSSFKEFRANPVPSSAEDPFLIRTSESELFFDAVSEDLRTEKFSANERMGESAVL